MAEETRQVSRYRRPQFSLKTLLSVTTVVAIAVGVPMFLRRQAGLVANSEPVVDHAHRHGQKKQSLHGPEH